MTAPITWDRVHVGDTVRGADQRAWTVVGREALSGVWIGTGANEARFELTLGDRRVVALRPLDAAAPMVERTDHAIEAGAYAALMTAFPHLSLLEETAVTVTDQFAAPATSFEPKHDRWGRYLLPDPETGAERAWTRATTVARTLADEYGLTKWKLRHGGQGDRA